MMSSFSNVEKIIIHMKIYHISRKRKMTIVPLGCVLCMKKLAWQLKDLTVFLVASLF